MLFGTGRAIWSVHNAKRIGRSVHTVQVASQTPQSTKPPITIRCLMLKYFYPKHFLRRQLLMRASTRFFRVDSEEPFSWIWCPFFQPFLSSIFSSTSVLYERRLWYVAWACKECRHPFIWFAHSATLLKPPVNCEWCCEREIIDRRRKKFCARLSRRKAHRCR